MDLISKSDFKAHALEVLRDIERTGNSKIITDRGKLTLEIRKLRRKQADPLQHLRGTVVKSDCPMSPVADDDWTNA